MSLFREVPPPTNPPTFSMSMQLTSPAHTRISSMCLGLLANVLLLWVYRQAKITRQTYINDSLTVNGPWLY